MFPVSGHHRHKLVFRISEELQLTESTSKINVVIQSADVLCWQLLNTFFSWVTKKIAALFVTPISS